MSTEERITGLYTFDVESAIERWCGAAAAAGAFMPRKLCEKLRHLSRSFSMQQFYAAVAAAQAEVYAEWLLNSATPEPRGFEIRITPSWVILVWESDSHLLELRLRFFEGCVESTADIYYDGPENSNRLPWFQYHDEADVASFGGAVFYGTRQLTDQYSLSEAAAAEAQSIIKASEKKLQTTVCPNTGVSVSWSDTTPRYIVYAYEQLVRLQLSQVGL